MENIDYSQLSAEEYEKIMYVLKRDEKLRRQEEQRLFHLKAELHRLRKRGAIKPGMDQSRVCARCLNELGRLLNRGAICPVCRKTVCKSCRSTSHDENLWLCLVCHKQMQLKAASGEWMREFSRSASEKLRSPSSRSPINHSSSTSGGTESFGKSIKQSLISGFSTSPNTSRTQLCEDYERQPVRQQPQIPYSYVQQTQASIQPQAFVPHPPQPYQMLPTSPQHPPLALHSSCPPYTQQPPSPHHPIPTHQYSAPASFMQPQAPFQPLPPQPFLQQHASFQQQQPLTAFPQTQIHPQSQQSFHNHNHHLPPIPQQSPHHHPSVQPPSQTAPDPPRNPSPKASSTRRQLPPKLPSVDCSARAPLQRSSSNNSSGGSQETSPKPPISPVLKAAYQAAVDLVERKKDSVSPPYNSNLKEPKETVYRKVSTRLQDSSSSEEEEEEEASGAASLYGVKSIDSSPSPRTLNSYKILSSVAHNQATAFKFPPSPYSSRPSSQSRQSSDEISTTFSSLISRSTSSDNNEDPNATSPGNPPNAMARVRRMSMLVKQQAIAEEFNNEISSTVQKLADATNVSRTDSGLSDSNYTSSPRSSSSRAGNRGSGGSEQLFWRTSPKKKNSTGSSGGLGVNDSDDSDDSSENNSSDTVEKTTGYIFRKVTAKRRVSRNETSPESGNQENGSHMRSPSPSIQGNSTRSASGGSSDGNSRGSNSRTSPAKSPTKSPAKTTTSLMGDPRSLIGGGPVYKSKSQESKEVTDSNYGKRFNGIRKPDLEENQELRKNGGSQEPIAWPLNLSSSELSATTEQLKKEKEEQLSLVKNQFNDYHLLQKNNMNHSKQLKQEQAGQTFFERSQNKLLPSFLVEGEREQLVCHHQHHHYHHHHQHHHQNQLNPVISLSHFSKLVVMKSFSDALKEIQDHQNRTGTRRRRQSGSNLTLVDDEEENEGDDEEEEEVDFYQVDSIDDDGGQAGKSIRSYYLSGLGADVEYEVEEEEEEESLAATLLDSSRYVYLNGDDLYESYVDTKDEIEYQEDIHSGDSDDEEMYLRHQQMIYEEQQQQQEYQQQVNQYGNPLAYSLHTILEESETESLTLTSMSSKVSSSSSSTATAGEDEVEASPSDGQFSLDGMLCGQIADTDASTLNVKGLPLQLSEEIQVQSTECPNNLSTESIDETRQDNVSEELQVKPDGLPEEPNASLIKGGTLDAERNPVETDTECIVCETQNKAEENRTTTTTSTTTPLMTVKPDISTNLNMDEERMNREESATVEVDKVKKEDKVNVKPHPDGKESDTPTLAQSARESTTIESSAFSISSNERTETQAMEDKGKAKVMEVMENPTTELVNEKESSKTDSKESNSVPNTAEVMDFMTRFLVKLTKEPKRKSGSAENQEEKNASDGEELSGSAPVNPIQLLESQITRLMLSVSPMSPLFPNQHHHQHQQQQQPNQALVTGPRTTPATNTSNSSSTCSSTIGSNNSDYGSDIVDLTEYSSEDEKLSSDTASNSTNHNLVNKLTGMSPGITRRESVRSTTSNASTTKSVDSAASEETVYICQQLLGSLKRLTQLSSLNEDTCSSSTTATANAINPMSATSSSPKLDSSSAQLPTTDFSKAKTYIRDQIVALMHTVQSSSSTSQQGSPQMRATNKVASESEIRASEVGVATTSNAVATNSSTTHDLHSSATEYGFDYVVKSESSRVKKTPSESGSETISVSVSIPSYDDSDNTATECEVSHEMEELFSMITTTENGANCSIDLLGQNRIETNLDEDRASVKSWEARISLFSNVKAALEDHRGDGEEALDTVSYNANNTLFNSIECQPQEITVNGRDVFGKSTTRKQESQSPSSGTNSVNNNSDNHYATNNTNNNSNNHHKTVVKVIDDPGRSQHHHPTGDTSPLFESLKDRSFSSDSVSSVLTVKARSINVTTASISELSLEGTHSGSALNVDDDSSNRHANGLGNKSQLADTQIDPQSPPTSSTSSLLCSSSSALRQSFNNKEKASSENNLLVANLLSQTMDSKSSSKVTGTKSAGNISEFTEVSCSKSTFRDTGYYSFKSSEESIKSLDECHHQPSCPTANNNSSATGTSSNSSNSNSYSTLPSSNKHYHHHHHHLHLHHHHHHHQYPLSSSTILEVEEENENSWTAPTSNKRRFTPSSSVLKCQSYSSSSIPDEVFTGTADKSNSLPMSCRSIPSTLKSAPNCPPSSLLGHRSRSSFFSTSGVLRKLAMLKDDRSLGRKPRPKTRTASGGTICVNSSGVPQISVSDYSESISNRGSSISTTDNNDEDVDSAFAYHSRSQTSLSSFGIRSESMSSIYSAAGGGRYGVVNVTGEILFSLSYNNTSGLMELHIKECRNLAPVDTKRNRSDPYVKVYLLPDRTKAGKRKTKVRKHTLDPVFDEVLRFNLGPFELDKRTLWISVWHSDIFGRNDFLGEVTLPLGRDVFKNTGLRWYPLQDRIEDSDLIYKGDLFLALKFVPADFVGSSKRAKHETRGELHVLVKEAHNLIPTRSNGTSDPFCKCYLLPDKNKTGKQKTPVAKKTCNPKWNYTFVYEDVCLESLKERCLELTVWDYDKLTSNDFLGGVRLSLGTGKSHGKPTEWMDSFGEEVNLWQQMLEKTNMWVYGELRLRPTLQTRH